MNRRHAAAALLALAAALASCGVTYQWGPEGRKVSVDVRPDLIAPAVGLIERHWVPPFER